MRVVNWSRHQLRSIAMEFGRLLEEIKVLNLGQFLPWQSVALIDQTNTMTGKCGMGYFTILCIAYGEGIEASWSVHP